MGGKWGFNIGYLLLAAIAILFLQQYWSAAQTVDVIPYSEFETLLRQDKFASVEVSDKYLRAKLKTPLPDGRKQVAAARVDTAIAQELEANKVKFSGVVENTWISTLLSWIIPTALFFFLWSLLARRMNQGLGSMMSIG